MASHCASQQRDAASCQRTCQGQHWGPASVYGTCTRPSAVLTAVPRCRARPAAWAAGTGYGMGYRGANAEVWDSRAAAAAQAAHDAELQVRMHGDVCHSELPCFHVQILGL